MPRPAAQRSRVSSALRWAILLFLGWSQVSFAAHQFEHSIAEAEPLCAVCVQFDRDDDATLSHHISPVAFGPLVPPSFAVPQYFATAERFDHYRSRASP